MHLVPNVIDANVFDFQAAVEETTLTGQRFTWRRHGDGNSMKPGTVVTCPFQRPGLGCGPKLWRPSQSAVWWVSSRGGGATRLHEPGQPADAHLRASPRDLHCGIDGLRGCVT